ncbi:hypothetical protein F2P81_013406 [Scophthalmus maximus]|uniref:Uncharacterized protein n=1 Tax=Scophthalmus maximus TaxID=52904 RepID=A0A6A4SN14_SCOMX|nr:hypothetical protein F2P81_013406 [Scophthalmus maximus]
MQKISEAFILDDDMVDGDLGDGKDIRAARRSTGSLDDPSKDELKGRLQEASEVIDVLCSELDVAHRYLEGKYQALKILEGKAILDKATSHTKSLLQKSDQRAKALEKESMKACFLSVQLAVLGACRCVGAAEACPCSRTAATSRKQLVQLQQELNDKDEALAHQRKVSLMLAHSADELQRQLHLDSPCQASDPSESSVPSQQPRDPSRDQSRSQQRAESPESNRREEQQVATKDEKCVLSH